MKIKPSYVLGGLFLLWLLNKKKDRVITPRLPVVKPTPGTVVTQNGNGGGSGAAVGHTWEIDCYHSVI